MRRLLVRYGLAMTSVVVVAFLVPLAMLARSLAVERGLASGRQDAQSVAVFAGGTGQDAARLEAAVLAVNTGQRRTTVFLPDGGTVGAPADRTQSVELASLGRALTATVAGGAEVLVPVGGTSGVAVVRTFVPQSELSSGVLRSWLVLVAVGAILLIGTAVAGDRIAARLSRSVRDLALVADRLGNGELSARVTPSGPPEVRSVGAVLNELGGRVGDLLADERELVADLSHRLRTPITALRLDVDLLGDASERDRMAGHVDELVGAVDAIIHTARAHERRAPVRCDAASVVRARGQFWAVLAADQERGVQIVAPGPAWVPVGAADLGAALDVLLDNVFRHTPPGTAFAVRVATAEGQVRVEVCDEGPGLAEPGLAARGRSGSGGTGIGLDVARRTAAAGGGWLTVAPGPGGVGTVVVLELPAARPADDYAPDTVGGTAS